jgi:hypothetical protein
MPNGVRAAFNAYIIAVMIATIPLMFGITAYASGAVPAGSDPVAVVENLSEFIFGLIRAIGMIMLGFGIVQVGLSLKSHDASQRANGFLTLLGGVIIAFTKEILTLITS